MEKMYYSYDMCKNDTKALIEKCKDFEPQVLLAVARGGLTLSHLMASALNIRDLFVVNSLFYDENKQLEAPNIFNIPDLSKLSKAKKVLIIDDIIDSGTTINEILKILQERFPQIEFKVATIFYKKTAIIKPDFFVRYTDIWVDFFWDVDIK